MMDHTAHDMAEQRVPTKAGSASVAKSQESPRKKKKRTGITLSQKQAVIDNLQLEGMSARKDKHDIKQPRSLTRLYSH